MPDNLHLQGLNTREAVEEVAHEIRTHQLSILSLVQVLRRVESGELNIASLPANLQIPRNLDSIQQCVHEISQLMDTLVDHVRDVDES